MELLERRLSNLSGKIAIFFINFISILNSIPIGVFLFIIFIICYATIVPRANEENYLGLSKYFMDNSWIINSMNFNEVPGTRVLYQTIFGSILKFLSFESTVLLGRLLLSALYSYALGKFLKNFNLKNISLLLIFPIIFFQNQSYFAGSWLFLSVESKCFSYFFVFLSLHYFINDNWRKVLVFIIIATYFHVLIGGFTFLYLIASNYLFGKSHLIEIIKRLALYTISISPFLFFISSSMIIENENQIVNPDWIYTYFRNAHHTVMYIHWDHFKNLHLLGVLKSIASVAILLIIYNKTKDKKLLKLSEIGILTFLASILLISVSIFDKNGFLLKFYLYRINTLSVFLSIVIFCSYLHKSKFFNNIVLNAVILFFGFYSLYNIALKNINNVNSYLKSDSAYMNICQDIKEKTLPRDVILYLTSDNHHDGQLDFIRRTERSSFVVHKFVPAQRSKLNDWYQKLIFRKKIFKNINELRSAQELYNIDYILAKRTYNNLDLVSEHLPYKLYKVSFSGQSK